MQMGLVNISSFQRMRRLQAEKKAAKAKPLEAEKGPKNDQNEPPGNELDVEALTKNQIIAELEKRKIDFNARDNKDVLKGLLIDGANG